MLGVMDIASLIRDNYSTPERPPAPAALFVVQDFANAHFAEEPEDRGRAPEAMLKWLRRFDLVSAGAHLSAQDVRQVLAVRGALRSLLEANDGHAADRKAIESLNAAASRAPLVVRFERGTPRLRPAVGGIDAAIAQLLAAVTAAVADGTWERLKICRADDCHWAFYDTSRNHSGAWCSMAGCGNRAKARAYRRRHPHRR